MGGERGGGVGERGMYEALHEINSEAPASGSQGRGRGRWGEWWRGGEVGERA